MAEIPRYDSAQVRETPLPGVRQESVASPALFSGAYDEQAKTGAGMLAAGNALSAAAYQMAEKENLQAVQDATTVYGEKVLDFQINAKKNRTGSGAAGITGDFSDFHKQTTEEIEKSLGNAAQKRAFRAMTQKSGLATRHEIATFEVGETNKAGAASYEANIANYTNLGAVAVTPEVVSAHRKSVVDSTKAFAATRNLDDATTQALLTAKLTEFHAQRIQQLARMAPEAAKQYFEENKGEIAGTRQAEIGAFADKATAEGMGVRTGGELWQQFGPKGDRDPIELDKLEEAARQKFKDNPDALKATITNLRERTAAIEKGRSERSNALMADVAQAVMGGASLSQIRSMPSFMALPADKALRFQEHIESVASSRASRAAANESRADAAEARAERRQRRDAYPLALKLSDPDVLARMSRNEIMALLPDLGTAHTEHLLNKHEAITKSADKLTEARIDNEDFKMHANAAGFDIEKAKGDDARRLIGLRNRVEQQIALAQQAKKGPLTRDEKTTILQREIDNAVMVDRSFWPDPKRPVSTLKPDEQARAYVNVGGTEVRLSSIPATDRMQIIQARQRRGLPTSEEDIARTWLGAKQPKQKENGLK